MEKKPSDHPVRETSTEARQGLLGRPVLVVLVCGLILAAVAWGIAEIYGESTDSTAVEQGESAPAGNQPAQDAAPPSANEPTTNAPVDRDVTPQTGSGGDSQTNSPDGTSQ
ncbi:MAG: hypothetical protein ACRECY_01640 [Phyllobacterium sp.]